MMLTRREVLALSAAAPLLAAKLSEVRLGVTTDEIDEDLLTAIRLLREFGLAWAEVRNIWGKYNTVQPIEKIKEARALFQEYGVRVSVLATGFFKVPLPAEGSPQLAEQWRLLDAAFERARILGTNKIRVFAFNLKDGEQPGPNDFARICELLREAARKAKARGFLLALENVGGSYVSTGAQAAAILKAIPDPTLGLAWDPNNAGASGEQAFPDGYRLLDPARIFHVHLRDYRKRADGKVEWCAVGEGEFDNLGQIRALRQDGFEGTFTLETHYRHPLGKAHATRTSLAALLKVIEQA